jgi:hypothetical protein
VHTWFRKRTTHAFCQTGCREKFVDVKKLPDGALLVSAESVCPDCLKVLIAGLGENFTDIERARIGFAPEETEATPEPVPVNVVAFKGRIVTFEDGRTEAVADFQILNAAVTVGEMQKFCDQTGYVTSAERRGPDELGVYDTFKQNGFLHVLEPAIHPLQEAEYLSYNDAVAFCTWSGHRLLTEGEYFVGAQFDDRVHPREPNHKDVVRAFDTGKIACFANSGGVITQTRVGDQIVVRFGPTVVKSPDWASDFNRELVGPDHPAGLIVRVLR